MSCSTRLDPHPRARHTSYTRSLAPRGFRAPDARSTPSAPTSLGRKTTAGALPSPHAGRARPGGPGPAASARLFIYIRHALSRASQRRGSSSGTTDVLVSRQTAGAWSEGWGEGGEESGPGGETREDGVPRRPEVAGPTEAVG